MTVKLSQGKRNWSWGKGPKLKKLGRDLGSVWRKQRSLSLSLCLEGGEEEEMASCMCCRTVILVRPIDKSSSVSSRTVPIILKPKNFRVCGARASMVDSYESSPDFVKRTEQAWLISQQPRPMACNSCDTKGHVECKWCGGTGFFILGDNMLCQVPSRNTTCVICAGQGSSCCSDCKGTGFRAKWLGKPPISN